MQTSADLDHAYRLLDIERGLEEWVLRTEPDAVAVERVFAQHNLHSVMGTAQAAGIAMLIAARHQIPVALHTPTEVKAAVTGTGRADKAQVAAMVVRILDLPTRPTPVDATDALALAICHVWRGSANDRIARAVAAAPQSRIPTRTRAASAAGAPPRRVGAR